MYISGYIDGNQSFDLNCIKIAVKMRVETFTLDVIRANDIDFAKKKKEEQIETLNQRSKSWQSDFDFITHAFWYSSR